MIRRILTILGLSSVVGGSITDCDSSFAITSIGLYPDPPVRNQPLYMDLQFNNNGLAVSDGTVYTSLTYNGLPIAVDPKPLCSDTACPIPQGYNNRSTATTCPDVSGKVTSQIKWVSPEGATLLCIQTVLKVGSPALRGSDSSTTGSYYEDNDDTTGSSEPLPPVKDLTVWRAPVCPVVAFGPELAVVQSAPHDESPRLRVGLTRQVQKALRAHKNEEPTRRF
jgi:hypothetical protein